MALPTLIYFPLRGRAELIRLVLAEAGVEYMDHPVAEGTPSQNGRPTDFDALKASGELAFGAVPVWIDADGFHLAQSLAIVNYLARQHGLHGKTSREQALVEQALGGFEDARGDLRKIALAEKSEVAKLREGIVKESAPRWLGAFEALLKANGGQFLAGSSVTCADLALWYLAELYRDNGFGAVLDSFPLVAAHVQRIGARPRIAAYVGSPKRFPLSPLPR